MRFSTDNVLLLRLQILMLFFFFNFYFKVLNSKKYNFYEQLCYVLFDELTFYCGATSILISYNLL